MFGKLTHENIVKNTNWSEYDFNSMLKKVNAYQMDTKNSQRIAFRKCKTCYYLKGDRIVTQAFTEWDCKNCGEKHMHHNGGTPSYCDKCSDEHSVCIDCGGLL